MVQENRQGFANEQGVLWIPANDALIKLRILIAAHTDMAGHRGPNVTLASVKAHFQ